MKPRQRTTRQAKHRHDAIAVPAPDPEAGQDQREADFARARALFAAEVLPGVADFRAYMATQNRKMEATLFLDHIEGPQIIVTIARPDGVITATLLAAVTQDGIRPYWDVRSTGRVKTGWVENIRGGVGGLTRDHVREKLTELFTTDFS